MLCLTLNMLPPKFGFCHNFWIFLRLLLHFLGSNVQRNSDKSTKMHSYLDEDLVCPQPGMCMRNNFREIYQSISKGVLESPEPNYKGSNNKIQDKRTTHNNL